jgi:hypothetical protein
LVNVLFSVSRVTAFNKVRGLLSLEATGGVRELEWPEKSVCLLEVRTDSNDFVNQVFHTNDAVFTEVVFNDLVVCDGQTLFVDLCETTLVDEFLDSLEIGISPGDVRTNPLQHLKGSLVQLNKDTRVDTVQTEKFEYFPEISIE